MAEPSRNVTVRNGDVTAGSESGFRGRGFLASEPEPFSPQEKALHIHKLTAPADEHSNGREDEA